ncbi:hypothetical protein [Streptomyces sp. NPDC002467]|uniref:hypothetical protein n=1 Tax=Streptomyces sp. NPDC002467 TaxID=3364647 RepID=UPI00369838CE
MSASEKIKAEVEQAIGKAVRKAAHALGNESTAAKGAALQGPLPEGKGQERFQTFKL